METVRPHLARLCALAVLGVVALAPAAPARHFRMSATWDLRRGPVYLPLQFPSSPWPGTGGPPPPFPNGPVLGSGGVVATGSAPAALRIPRHRFGGPFTAKVPFLHSMLDVGSVVQLTTRITPEGPVDTATLAPGAGPGSFTWCPGDPACVAGGGMLSTDPPQGAGARNGRIVYRAGASHFGGTMQLLLSGRGMMSFVFQAGTPALIGQIPFASDAGTQHTGGPYAFVAKQYQARGILTVLFSPPPPGGLITQPGPQCCGGTGSPFTPFYFPTVITTPMGFKAGQFTTHTGFPFTTGTIFAQQTMGTGADELFTQMGSDLRTPLGAGNITLVSGGLTLRHYTTASTPQASFGRVRMTLAAPIPSLSPAAFAAAGALVLVAAGWALHRRR